MKRSFSRINKGKAISLAAFVYDFLWFVFFRFLSRWEAASLGEPTRRNLFWFPSTLKLFAFMINYKIPLTFHAIARGENFLYSWNIYRKGIDEHFPHLIIRDFRLTRSKYIQWRQLLFFCFLNRKTCFRDISMQSNCSLVSSHKELIYTCGMERLEWHSRREQNSSQCEKCNNSYDVEWNFYFYNFRSITATK